MRGVAGPIAGSRLLSLLAPVMQGSESRFPKSEQNVGQFGKDVCASVIESGLTASPYATTVLEGGRVLEREDASSYAGKAKKNRGEGVSSYKA